MRLLRTTVKAVTLHLPTRFRVRRRCRRFIRQEAEEKAAEIAVSAEEEFNITKLQVCGCCSVGERTCFCCCSWRLRAASIVAARRCGCCHLGKHSLCTCYVSFYSDAPALLLRTAAGGGEGARAQGV